MSWGVGHRLGSDLMLLWLWYRPVAVAPIQPLAWEPPHAVSVALEKTKKKEEKKEEEEKRKKAGKGKKGEEKTERKRKKKKYNQQ